MIKRGDQVRFLNAVGGGIVTRVDETKKMVYVEDADGFEVPVFERECLLVGTINKETNFPVKDFSSKSKIIIEPTQITERETQNTEREIRNIEPIIETPEGDAKYFYGAECSGNAFLAMQNYDAGKLSYYYRKAFDKGAYPKWLAEFGRNFLMGCDTNAILFTGGNADFDICSYLQLCENFRTDITVIPIGNIDRPWYVQFLKNGLKGGVRNITLNLTEQQITDIHPFKWEPTTVSIRVSPTDKKYFGLPDDYLLQWEVFPDLFSERMHTKTESEKAKARAYLSPQRAILLQIVEDNFAERPIYFSNFASPAFYGGLDSCFQYCGLVSKLLPVKTSGSKYAVDKLKLEALLCLGNLGDYKSIQEHNIPRISRIALSGYSNAFVYLAELYKKSDETDKLKSLIALYEDTMHIHFDPEYETETMNALKK